MSQDANEIYLTMAKFDKAYVEFLQGKAEKDAPRSFMRMHLFGPWHIDYEHEMRDFAKHMLAFTLRQLRGPGPAYRAASAVGRITGGSLSYPSQPGSSSGRQRKRPTPFDSPPSSQASGLDRRSQYQSRGRAPVSEATMQLPIRGPPPAGEPQQEPSMRRPLPKTPERKGKGFLDRFGAKKREK